MAQAAPALAQNVMDAINTRATAQYNAWKTTATPEQKQGGMERLEKYRNDPAMKAEMHAKMTQMWTDADADQDGKLNLAEYRVWQGNMDAMAIERGDWRESGDHMEENYNISNMISEGDGVTMAEMFMVMGPWMAKFEELKAADQ